MHRIVFLLFMLGLLTMAQAITQPPVGAPDLRNAYASLSAVPGIPDAFKVNFNDAQVWLRSITVQPTGTPEGGSCRVLVRINNLLAKVLIVQPPDAVNISEPPGQIVGLDGVILAGIDQPIPVLHQALIKEFVNWRESTQPGHKA